MRVFLRNLGLGLVFSGLAIGLLTVPVGTLRAAVEPLYDKPVYDPVSKRYFELVYVRTTQYSSRHVNDVLWKTAYGLARTMGHNGVGGRLAIIDSAAVREFLMRTFHPAIPAWIGLRYWCGTRTAQTVTGHTLTETDFQAWDVNWNQAQNACRTRTSEPEYLPVAVTPASEGFTWIAKAWGKGYSSFFVEYATGKP